MNPFSGKQTHFRNPHVHPLPDLTSDAAVAQLQRANAAARGRDRLELLLLVGHLATAAATEELTTEQLPRQHLRLTPDLDDQVGERHALLLEPAVVFVVLEFHFDLCLILSDVNQGQDFHIEFSVSLSLCDWCSLIAIVDTETLDMAGFPLLESGPKIRVGGAARHAADAQSPVAMQEHLQGTDCNKFLIVYFDVPQSAAMIDEAVLEVDLSRNALGIHLCDVRQDVGGPTTPSDDVIPVQKGNAAIDIAIEHEDGPSSAARCANDVLKGPEDGQLDVIEDELLCVKNVSPQQVTGVLCGI